MHSSRIAGSYGNSVFNILRKWQTFSKWVSFHIPLSSLWRFQFSHIFINTCFFLNFWWQPSYGWSVISHCVFNLHFLDDYWCQFFLSVIFIFSLEKCLFRTFPHFYIGLFAFYYCVLRIVFIWNISLLANVQAPNNWMTADFSCSSTTSF